MKKPQHHPITGPHNNVSFLQPGSCWEGDQKHRDSVKTLALPLGPWHTPLHMHSTVFSLLLLSASCAAWMYMHFSLSF